MKSIFSLIFLLSNSILFAQLPTKNPFFKVTQYVGSAEISFNYKPTKTILFDSTQQEINFGGETTEIVVNISDTLTSNETVILPGNYYLGIKKDNKSFSLFLESERELERRLEENQNEFQNLETKIKGNLTNDYDFLNGLNQQLIIYPINGTINNSNLIIGFSGVYIEISFNNDLSGLISKVKKGVEKARENEFEKHYFAAKFLHESGTDSRLSIELANVAKESKDFYYEATILLSEIYFDLGKNDGGLMILHQLIESLKSNYAEFPPEAIKKKYNDLLFLIATKENKLYNNNIDKLYINDIEK